MQRKWTLVLTVTALSLSVIVSPANAVTGGPSANEILLKCGDGVACSFDLITPKDGRQEIVAGKPTAVGPVINCTSSNAQRRISKAVTDGTSGHVEKEAGGSITVTLGKEGLASAAFTASYAQRWGIAWEKSKTFTIEDTVTVPPKYKMWLVRTPSLRKARGTYVVRFKSPYEGKFFYVVQDVVITGPNPNSGGGTTVLRSAKLTASEEKRFCT
ncbi:hypothetical protein [Amycolatopsis sp. cmx-11-12]|uniref:hypothetical protein n=1 Tax=Amycolatopsis sp. cmx-11-12 TaxID=2785795 RepID=UPI00391834D1